MEQKRKRAFDEKANHFKNRQKRQQYTKEYQDIDYQLNQYSRYNSRDLVEQDNNGEY